jgi:hypothetical protein
MSATVTSEGAHPYVYVCASCNSTLLKKGVDWNSFCVSCGYHMIPVTYDVSTLALKTFSPPHTLAPERAHLKRQQTLSKIDELP